MEMTMTRSALTSIPQRCLVLLKLRDCMRFIRIFCEFDRTVLCIYALLYFFDRMWLRPKITLLAYVQELCLNDHGSNKVI